MWPMRARRRGASWIRPCAVHIGRTCSEDVSGPSRPAARTGGPGYLAKSDGQAAPSKHFAAHGDVGVTRRAARAARNAGRPGAPPRVALCVPQTAGHRVRLCTDCAHGAHSAHVERVFRVQRALRLLQRERLQGAHTDLAARTRPRAHARSPTTRARRHVGARARSHRPPAQGGRGRTHSARDDRHAWGRRCAVTEARAECCSRCAGAASVHVLATARHGRREHRPVEVGVQTVLRSGDTL
jgi:hypothetical protein